MTDPYGYFYENDKNSATNSNWYTNAPPLPPQNIGQPVNNGWDTSTQNGLNFNIIILFIRLLAYFTFD